MLAAAFVSVPVSAQKKRPPTKKTAVQDTVKSKRDTLSLEEKKKLPVLKLREYTITGTERVRILPSQRRAIEMADYTRSERISALESGQNRSVPGSGGQKAMRVFDTPVAGLINEAYVSFGRYSDLNAGVKLRRKYVNDEFFSNVDYHRSSGHVDYADYYSFDGDVAHIRSLAERIQNKARAAVNFQQYRFYGSLINPGQKRNSLYFDAANVTDIMRWEPVQFSFEVGGRYHEPDNTRIFNWDLWSRLNWRTVAHSTFIYGGVEANTDRIKDGGSGNAPISDANYMTAFCTVERLITARLHVKAGAAYYYAYSKNANLQYAVVNDMLVLSGPFLVERERSIVYPQAALTYDFGEQGRFFIEYEPAVESFSLLDKLRYNRYLQTTSPLSHEDVSQNLKIGWRRSYAYDLSFEVFYNDKRIKNYGILLDNGVNVLLWQGIWSYVYGNVIDINEYRGAVNWNPHPRFYAWCSLSYADYTVRSSSFADRLPYLPNMTGDFSAQFMPGWGTQIILDGQYIGGRNAAPFDIQNMNAKLDSYFIANITISKQWTKQLGSYIFLDNLFDQDYEVWQGYRAPDFMTGAGLRCFW